MIVSQAATDPTSATYRSLNPDWRWTLDAHLLAAQLDELRLMLWAKTEDAAKKPPRNRPFLVERPGVLDPRKNVITGDVMTLADAKAWASTRLDNDNTQE